MKLKAFTLAEVITVVALLGIVAALIIPTQVRRTTERQQKTTIKKALSVYQNAIEKIIVENNLPRDNATIDRWASDNNYQNVKNMFKTTNRGNGCEFQTSDKLWWSVCADGNNSLTNAIVAFDRNNLTRDIAESDESNLAFNFVTSFDGIGSVRVNDIQYEANNGSVAKEWATKKVDCYLKGETNCKYPGMDFPWNSSDWASGCNNNNGQICCGDFCLDTDPEDIPKQCYNNGIASVGNSDNTTWCYTQRKCFRNQSTGAVGVCVYQAQDAPLQLSIDGNSYRCNPSNGGQNYECHINGSQVPDIQYDKDGNPSGYVCTPKGTFADSIGDCESLRQTKECKTALCHWNPDYDNGEGQPKGKWIPSSDSDQSRWSYGFARCLWMQSNGTSSNDPECAKVYNIR